MTLHGITLQPGDVLLYSRRGFWSTVIKVKTWSHVTHCEMVGADTSTTYASRPGIGVWTFYPIDTRDVCAILRPVTPLDMAAVKAFHASCIGQAYDWLGLLRFFTIGKQSQTRQFCSEHTTRCLRAGGNDPFVPTFDADLVSPGLFLTSPRLMQLWSLKES